MKDKDISAQDILKSLEDIDIAIECRKAFEIGVLDASPYNKSLNRSLQNIAYLVGRKYSEKYGLVGTLPHISFCFYEGIIGGEPNFYDEQTEISYKIGLRFRDKYLTLNKK